MSCKNESLDQEEEKVKIKVDVEGLLRLRCTTTGMIRMEGIGALLYRRIKLPSKGTPEQTPQNCLLFLLVAKVVLWEYLLLRQLWWSDAATAGRP